jgi:hypothetical protein
VSKGKDLKRRMYNRYGIIIWNINIKMRR